MISLLTKAHAALFGMPSATRRRWAEPADIGDLGQLQSLWFGGTLRGAPNLPRRPGTGLIALSDPCARACRAGFYIAVATPAVLYGGPHSEPLITRAGVYGFVGNGDWRIDVLTETLGNYPDLSWDARRIPDVDDRTTVPVYLAANRNRSTMTGPFWDAPAIADTWKICRPEAIAALRYGWQIAIVEDREGRDDSLAEALAVFAGRVERGRVGS